MSALSPCPWPNCGSSNLTLATGKTCFVVCDSCGARGPRVFTANDARAAWNRRTPPPLPTREEVADVIRKASRKPQNEGDVWWPDQAADAVLRLLGGEKQP